MISTAAGGMRASPLRMRTRQPARRTRTESATWARAWLGRKHCHDPERHWIDDDDFIPNDNDAVPAEPRIDTHDLFWDGDEAYATRHHRADAKINVDVRHVRDIAARDYHVANARALLLIDLDIDVRVAP